MENQTHIQPKSKSNSDSTKSFIHHRFQFPPTKNQIQQKIPRKPNLDVDEIDGSLLNSARFKAAPNSHVFASCFSSQLPSTVSCSLIMPLGSSLMWLDERWMLWWYGQRKRRSAEAKIARKREINRSGFFSFY